MASEDQPIRASEIITLNDNVENLADNNLQNINSNLTDAQKIAILEKLGITVETVGDSQVLRFSIGSEVVDIYPSN